MVSSQYVFITDMTLMDGENLLRYVKNEFTTFVGSSIQIEVAMMVMITTTCIAMLTRN